MIPQGTRPLDPPLPLLPITLEATDSPSVFHLKLGQLRLARISCWDLEDEGPYEWDIYDNSMFGRPSAASPEEAARWYYTNVIQGAP